MKVAFNLIYDFSNQFGSSRYSAFLSGGLDPRDDGQFHYVWQNDAMQVVYHAATLMPRNESDPQFNKKERHIGNDYVAIVYNDSGDTYAMGTVKGQFMYAHIIGLYCYTGGSNIIYPFLFSGTYGLWEQQNKRGL